MNQSLEADFNFISSDKLSRSWWDTDIGRVLQAEFLSLSLMTRWSHPPSAWNEAETNT